GQFHVGHRHGLYAWVFDLPHKNVRHFHADLIGDTIGPMISPLGPFALHLAGCEKSPPASFSLRSEAQRTEAYASPLRSLRPCWTAFLSILRGAFLSCKTYRSTKFRHAHRIFPSLTDAALLRLARNRSFPPHHPG